jgi:hypothetical protein
VALLSLLLAAGVHGERVAAQVGPLPPAPDLPDVQVPELPLPEVTVPELPPPPPPPRLPNVSPPSLPDLPAVEQVLPQAPSPSAGGLRQAPGLPGGGSAPSGSSNAPSSAAGAGAGPAAADAAGGSATPAGARRSRSATARRRGPGWNRPLRGRPLRRLRRTLDAAAECLGRLSPRGRRALGLLAGGDGRAPVSRRVVARRLGVSGPGLIRLERRSLRTLRRAGGCGAAAAPVGAGVVAAAQGAEPLSWGGDAERAPGSGERPSPDAGTRGERRGEPDGAGALGAVESGEQQGSLDAFDQGAEGNPDALLFFLLALSILALGVVWGLRSKVTPAAAPAPARRPDSERPLLFLEVDGVLFLSPLAPSPPPGRVHFLDGGELYVPDRVTELLHHLETRFDLVWATGAGHFANRSLRRLFGLRGEMPAIELRGRGRFRPADAKVHPIEEQAGERPSAWVAELFTPSAHRWANRRRAPTLLLEVEHGAGLSEDHVATLMDWADALGSGAAHAASGQPAR